MKPTRPKSYQKLPKHSSQAQRIADEDLTDEEPIPWPDASVTDKIGGDDVNDNGTTPSNEETVPGPGAIAGMSPFAKQAKQCRGPVVSRSKQCIELRKKMNRSQEKKVSKMVNKLKKQQKINEYYEGEKPGESIGVEGSGSAKSSLDLVGSEDGSSPGRLAAGYNAPNSQYLARDPRTGKVNAGRVNGLDTSTASPTLSPIAQEMEDLGLDSTDPREVWRYGNSKASSSRLGSSIYALQNTITDPDVVQQWRNGDNSAVVPRRNDYFAGYGGHAYFKGDEDETVYESPNRMSWWRNNWKQRTLNEDEAGGGAQPLSTPTNSMGGNFATGQIGEPGPIAGVSDPALFSNRRKKKDVVSRLRRRRTLGEAQDTDKPNGNDPFGDQDRPGGMWPPVTLEPEARPIPIPKPVTWSWQEDFDGDGIPDTIYKEYPGGIIVRFGQECCGNLYHYWTRDANGKFRWHVSPAAPNNNGVPEDGSKPIPIRGGWGQDKPAADDPAFQIPSRFAPGVVNPRKNK